MDPQIQDKLSVTIPITFEQKEYLLKMANTNECSLESILQEAVKMHIECDGEYSRDEYFGEMKQSLKAILNEKHYGDISLSQSDLLKNFLTILGGERWGDGATIGQLRLNFGKHLAQQMAERL